MECVFCVMDRSDPEITFDAEGRCNHCKDAERTLADVKIARESDRLGEAVTEIKRCRKNYDCIIGLSGGVDSSYLAYKAVEQGLKPLAIHLDNGWDSELAVKNIENVVRKLDLDLHTHVVDWDEFRDIQLSFFRASVIDIEMITDHAINALAYDLARKHRIRFILTGVNSATEAILPRSWVHPKTDLRNLKAIHRRHGKVPLKTLPTASTLRIRFYQRVRRIASVNLLDLMDYDKTSAIDSLQTELGWTDYGGKHHESTFTRFYQQFVLPTKFGVDKRRAHLSSLICSRQITRANALEELEEPPYDVKTIDADKRFVAKKLGMSVEQFEKTMAEPPRSHYEYPSDQSYLRSLSRMKQRVLRGQVETSNTG